MCYIFSQKYEVVVSPSIVEVSSIWCKFKLLFVLLIV